MIKKINYTFFIAAFLLFISCSDNSSGPGDLGLSQGEGAITVSGDINKEYGGEAWYTVDPNNDEMFQLFVSDVEFSIDPEANDDISFVLELRQQSGSGLSAGEYSLGENAQFRGMLASMANAKAYYTADGSAGTLTITSYSSGLIEAEFEFSAAAEQGGSVTVSGGLRATCIGGQFNPNC